MIHVGASCERVNVGTEYGQYVNRMWTVCKGERRRRGWERRQDLWRMYDSGTISSRLGGFRRRTKALASNIRIHSHNNNFRRCDAAWCYILITRILHIWMQCNATASTTYIFPTNQIIHYIYLPCLPLDSHICEYISWAYVQCTTATTKWTVQGQNEWENENVSLNYPRGAMQNLQIIQTEHCARSTYSWGSWSLKLSYQFST
jgi:hypothetical protein